MIGRLLCRLGRHSWRGHSFQWLSVIYEGCARGCGEVRPASLPWWATVADAWKSADGVQPPDPRPAALSAELVAARLDRVTVPESLFAASDALKGMTDAMVVARAEREVFVDMVEAMQRDLAAKLRQEEE